MMVRQTQFLMVFDGFDEHPWIDARRRMPRRADARIDDVARLAGVSTATVDRVLNQRPGVRAVTVQRVLKAAGRARLRARGATCRRGALKPLRLAFLLPAGTNRFLTMLGRLIAASQDQLALVQHASAASIIIESFKPELLAQHLLRMAGAMSTASPSWRWSIRRCARRSTALAERGVPAVTLISDIVELAARRLCRARQPRGRAHGRLPHRPLHRAEPGQGRDDRRQPQLPRPRGARDGLPAPVPGAVPGDRGRRPARGP